jgi:hypothetical protein
MSKNLTGSRDRGAKHRKMKQVQQENVARKLLWTESGRPRAPGVVAKEHCKLLIAKRRALLEKKDANEIVRQKQTAPGENCVVCGCQRAAKGLDGRWHICNTPECGRTAPAHVGCVAENIHMCTVCFRLKKV